MASPAQPPPFSWTPESEQAFSSLKQALTESPILIPPDPNLPFILDTDASDVDIGAMLSQVGAEGEMMVYGGVRLSTKQNNAIV